MKQFILICFALLIITIGYYASAREAPSYLKGATIIVKTRTGETYKFDAELYAVVSRYDMGKKLVIVKTCKDNYIYKPHKPKIGIMFGQSKTDVYIKDKKVYRNFENDVGLIFNYKDYFIQSTINSNVYIGILKEIN